MVRALLEGKGTNAAAAAAAVVSARGPDGRTALHHAAAKGQTEVVRALLAAGADKGAKCQVGVALG